MTVRRINSLWHHNDYESKEFKTACGLDIPQGTPTLTLGGGRECGNDDDPPRKEMCPECFPWVKEEIQPEGFKTTKAWFACGGFYKVDRPGTQFLTDHEFKFVHGSKPEPYITNTECSLRLFSLCRHHSSLYRINCWFDKAMLVKRGEYRGEPEDPELITITPEQKTLLIRATQDPWFV